MIQWNQRALALPISTQRGRVRTTNKLCPEAMHGLGPRF